MYAAYVSHDTVVNLLLEARADANKGTPGGVTPLMVAAGCGNESICYFLIQVDTGELQVYIRDIVYVHIRCSSHLIES